ncbi:hypothetical protein EG329_000224 [Mollisiaceae sp. DMI_Dod_QoI]|nr:hypothetical protein EG329_000224 [Helotiales sp. DMI_Dod_QoI]
MGHQMLRPPVALGLRIWEKSGRRRLGRGSRVFHDVSMWMLACSPMELEYRSKELPLLLHVLCIVAKFVAYAIAANGHWMSVKLSATVGLIPFNFANERLTDHARSSIIATAEPLSVESSERRHIQLFSAGRGPVKLAAGVKALRAGVCYTSQFLHKFIRGQRDLVDLESRCVGVHVGSLPPTGNTGRDCGKWLTRSDPLRCST